MIKQLLNEVWLNSTSIWKTTRSRGDFNITFNYFIFLYPPNLSWDLRSIMLLNINIFVFIFRNTVCAVFIDLAALKLETWWRIDLQSERWTQVTTQNFYFFRFLCREMSLDVSQTCWCLRCVQTLWKFKHSAVHRSVLSVFFFCDRMCFGFLSLSHWGVYLYDHASPGKHPDC